MRVKSKQRKGKSILVKLVLIMMLLSITSGAIILGVALNEQRQNMEDHIIEDHAWLAQVAARSIEAGYVEQSWPFRTLGQINESEHVLFWWIVDPGGEIHLADNPDMCGRRIADASVPASSKAGKAIVKDYIYSGENIKFIVQPLYIGEPGEVWSLCIGFSLKWVNEAANRMIITALGYFSVIIAFACLLSFFLAKKVTKPITQLVEGTEAISRGNFDHRIEIRTGDEIEGLGKAFNKMAEQVRSSIIMEKMARTEIENIMNTMVETLIVVDPEGNIRNANEATFVLLGYNEDELIGKPVDKILSQKEAEEKIERLMKEGSIENFETTYLTKDGKEIPVSFAASAMKDEEGKLLSIVCTAGDITERKRAEEKLEEAYRLRENFLKETSHRIITPVTIIGGNSELLLESNNLDDAQKERIRTIREKNEEIQKLLKDALAGNYLKEEGDV
ncbi:MAG: PAS domain S-box protein [Halobacteriota archaeon]